MPNIKSKKIGILTFHNAINYGAALQTYALSTYLKKLGFEVEILNYVPTYIKNRDRIMPILPSFKPTSLLKFLLKSFCRLLIIKQLLSRKQSFKKFLKENTKLSNTITKSNIPKQDYDFIFLGSDQIWNPRLTEGGDNIYLGKFQTSAKKIGYAISAGAFVEELFSKQNNIGADFFAISAREQKLADRLIAENNNIECPVVMDPTFLLGEQDYSKFLKKEIEGDYIFVYEMTVCKDTMRIAKKIAKEKNLKIVRLKADYTIELPWGKLIDVSPQKFLSLIKYASCILTTSFHGTAFSIIFKRDFYFISIGKSNEIRISQMLKSFNLEDRFISEKDFSKFAPIVWDKKIEDAISLKVSQSKNFISKSTLQ